jgi:Protein of unknown function (DUF4232)
MSRCPSSTPRSPTASSPADARDTALTAPNEGDSVGPTPLAFPWNHSVVPPHPRPVPARLTAVACLLAATVIGGCTSSSSGALDDRSSSGSAPGHGTATPTVEVAPPSPSTASVIGTVPPTDTASTSSLPTGDETASSSIAPVDVCKAGNLQFTNPSNAIAGAEGVTVEIVFRNVGSQPCSLTGWPTIRTPGLHTKVQYSTFTGAGFEVAITRVVLQPGKTGATALDIFGSPGSDYGTQCFAAGSWAVTLPGSHQATSVPWPKYQGACPGGTLYVSPVYSGNQPEIGFGSADPTSIPLLGPFDSPPASP